MQDNDVLIKKLQTAINNKFGARIIVEQKQAWDEKNHRCRRWFNVKAESIDPDTNKRTQVVLFSGRSAIQIVLFLRDYWYTLNGWELPTDNEMWNEIRARKLGEKDATRQVPETKTEVSS